MKFVPPLPAELWGQVPAASQAAILVLVQHYEEQIRTLQEQVADLQQRLGQNSTNSSRPPSTDGLGVKRRPPHSPSGRNAAPSLAMNSSNVHFFPRMKRSLASRWHVGVAAVPFRVKTRTPCDTK